MAKGLHIPALLLVYPEADRRQERRADLLHGADDGEAGDGVVVTDISPRGARLIAPEALSVGTEVQLKLPLLEPIEGIVVWVSKRIAGCRFIEPLHPALVRVLLAASASTSGQAGWTLKTPDSPVSRR